MVSTPEAFGRGIRKLVWSINSPKGYCGRWDTFRHTVKMRRVKSNVAPIETLHEPRSN